MVDENTFVGKYNSQKAVQKELLREEKIRYELSVILRFIESFLSFNNSLWIKILLPHPPDVVFGHPV